MNTRVVNLVLRISLILLFAIFWSCGQKKEHEHQAAESTHSESSGHEHHTAATESMPIPELPSEILYQIEQKRAALNEAIATQKLDEVHPNAFALRDLFAALSEKSNELSEADQKKLQAGAKNIAALAEKLDQLGDAGDLAGVVAQNRQVQTLVKSLTGLFSAGEHAGHSMSEMPHGDHETKHGGVLGMSGDRHLELVDTGNEFRVYLYDAYTKPVSAKGVTGAVTIDGGKKFQLVEREDGAYLAAAHAADLQAGEATAHLNIKNEHVMMSFPLTMELEGKLVDVGCFARDGLAALRDDHQACTKTCIEAGAPVGIVTDETDAQSLYLVTLREGGSVKAANQKLIDFLHKKIRLSGKIIERSGLKVIELNEVSALN